MSKYSGSDTLGVYVIHVTHLLPLKSLFLELPSFTFIYNKHPFPAPPMPRKASEPHADEKEDHIASDTSDLGEDEYEVEKIVKHRASKVLFYLPTGLYTSFFQNCQTLTCKPLTEWKRLRLHAQVDRLPR